MNDEGEHLEAAGRISDALTRTADALAGARLDDLLAAEGGLATAVAAWPAAATPGGPEHNQLRQELARLQASLERCRRLGLVLDTFAGASLSAYGCARGYDRSGVAQVRAVPDAHALEARA
ncbi:MAG TPA: hypothetical protein VK911_13840 [Vicinamibacterales bacterium]|nr:hypothetical protein [Vicinamibacterales bacterium]